MKPWLFDILACPIDKHFPLKLYIFTFENKQDEFLSIINVFKKRDAEIIKSENIIEIFKEKNKIYIKDNIITKKTQLKPYLEQILASINEFENIEDKSKNNVSSKCFKIIMSEIKPKILDFSKQNNFNNVEGIIPELLFINKIKLDFEIESGILYCNKCNRWYPIIDTIPQMLPDKYRDEKIEIEFLKNNKNLLDDKFLNQDLKPFRI